MLQCFSGDLNLLWIKTIYMNAKMEHWPHAITTNGLVLQTKQNIGIKKATARRHSSFFILNTQMWHIATAHIYTYRNHIFDFSVHQIKLLDELENSSAYQSRGDLFSFFTKDRYLTMFK